MVDLLPTTIEPSLLELAFGPIAIALFAVAPLLSLLPSSVELTEKYFTGFDEIVTVVVFLSSEFSTLTVVPSLPTNLTFLSFVILLITSVFVPLVPLMFHPKLSNNLLNLKQYSVTVSR
ncbi:hypothetical protein NYR30_11180 [Gallibacterium salpingitidis]|uniref:hypothetical protein n=1 Tax=Gallibacterium salpingitidis TaxID=505341 RepID=UPI00266FCEBC|nr:hypothetical protein [Gallibacterium salpingitidis]WKS99276.1 hypothetical protein NYR30_11180 [Gallibacterium salpingitidis]